MARIIVPRLFGDSSLRYLLAGALVRVSVVSSLLLSHSGTSRIPSRGFRRRVRLQHIHNGASDHIYHTVPSGYRLPCHIFCSAGYFQQLPCRSGLSLPTSRFLALFFTFRLGLSKINEFFKVLSFGQWKKKRLWFRSF